MIRRSIIEPDTTHDLLIPALGLDRYPITHEVSRSRKVPYEQYPRTGHMGEHMRACGVRG